MKKFLIYFVICLTILFNFSAKAEENTTNDSARLRMPTDAEIMETISKYDFKKEQQEYLFKETKRKLEELYLNQEFSAILEGDSTIVDDSSSEKKENSKKKKRTSGDDSAKKSKN